MAIKRLLILVLAAVCLCSSSAITAFAENEDTFYDEEILSPYEIAMLPSSTLVVNGTSVTCVSKTLSNNAERIGVLQVLQIWGGTSVGYVDVPHANWITCVFRPTVVFTNTKSGLSAGTYRLKSVFTLHDNDGNKEEVTIYSVAKTIN